MALRVVIVGPGRVGSAFGRRLRESSVEVLGFVGRRSEAAAAAVAFAGAGTVLRAADHPSGHVVLFAVSDDELEAAVTELLQSAPPRRCSLWLHTSGRHGLEVFDRAVAAGARRGSLHPVSPFADAESGYRHMAGQPAVVASDANGRRLLRGLCRRLGMVVVAARDGDRTLYHAACALAANGLVALRGLVDEVFAAAGELEPADARLVAASLMTTALASARDAGPAAALSGPVARGDAATVALHLAAVRAGVPAAVPAYRALMQSALRLAIARGLPTAEVAAIRAVLDAADD